MRQGRPRPQPNPLARIFCMDFSSRGRHYLNRCNNMRHPVRVSQYVGGDELLGAPRRVFATRRRGRRPGRMLKIGGQMRWVAGIGENPLSWNRSFSVRKKWSQKCKITLWRSLNEGGKSRKEAEIERPALSDFGKSDFSGRFSQTKNQPLFALILMSLHAVFSLWELAVLWVEERWRDLVGNRLIFVKIQEVDKQM